MIEHRIINRRIERFHIREFSYCSIGIEGGYDLACESLLRYVGDDGVFITNQDHGHMFGLENPYNAESEIENRIKGEVIKSVETIRDTSDLVLRMDNGRVELICSSSGYENWALNGPNGFVMVGHGGRSVK